ncbi:hypothetical protein M3Y97_00997200 [Aphelenchoides bicaudatus]|nr:hypothetical protein M3Y97_00997200 [Aphelenchoides bicaudatus]
MEARAKALVSMTDRQMPLAAFISLIAFFYERTNGFIQNDILSYCSMKSAPILLLAILSYTGKDFQGKLRHRCALGFLFGAAGDFLLSTNELGFRLGSISFGIGHLCFIAYFGPLLRVLSYGVTAACLLYAFFVNQFFIIPCLSNTPVAMLILIWYSIVILVAMVVAGSLYVNGAVNGQTGKDFRSLLTGYAVFFMSDTLVLLVHLGYAFPYSEIVILLSYYAAQYLIYHNAASVSASVEQVVVEEEKC